jgi:transposase
VVLEPTNAYHLLVTTALLEAGYQVNLVNPAVIVAYRASLGQRQKTDRADAFLLAHYGKERHTELIAHHSSDAQLEQLRALMTYRNDQLERQRSLRNQLESLRLRQADQIVSLVEQELLELKARVGLVETQIQVLLAGIPVAAEVMKVKGVGVWTTAAVLGFLPRALWGRAKSAVGFAGLHPVLHQSGSSVHRVGLCARGNRFLRKALFMSALPATLFNDEVKAFYLGLVGRGKSKMSAMLAAARKVLRVMMGVMREFFTGLEKKRVAEVA